MAFRSRLIPHSPLATDDAARLDRQFADVLATLDENDIPPLVTRLLAREYGFHATWIAEAAEGGIRVRHTYGARTHQHRNRMLHSGLGLGGKVFASRRVEWVDDYLDARSITHEYDDRIAAEGLRRVYAAPIVDGDRMFGVLFSAYRDDGACGDRAAVIVEGVAVRCARALSLARRAQAMTAAAVARDRQTIARLVRETVEAQLAPIRAHARSVADRTSTRASFGQPDAIERQIADAAAALLACIDALPAATDAERCGTISLACGPHGVTLGKREHELLRRVSTGATNNEIASAMNVSRDTVKSYLRNVMTKLGARNRVEAIARAREHGLL